MSNIIADLLIIYLISLLISFIYMLYIGDEVNFRINNEIKNRGYKKTTSSDISSYISDSLINLVPFYSIIHSKKVIKDSKYLNDYIDSKILSGKLVPINNNISIYSDIDKSVKEMEIDDSLFIPRPKVGFETPEPYKARTIDNSLYDSELSAEEYAIKSITKERTHENETPFVAPIEQIKEQNKVKEITEYITSLPIEDLNKLNDVIYKLIDRKQKRQY